MAAGLLPLRSPRVPFAATLLLLAWMPSLLFFGHWTELAAPSAHHSMTVDTHHEATGAADDARAATEAAQHALHCHGSSSCADQGGSASALHAGASSPLALAIRPLEVMALQAPTATVEGRASARPTAPPPRSAA